MFIKKGAGALSEIVATGRPMDIDASPSGSCQQALPLRPVHSACILV